MNWIKISLMLCFFEFLREIRPSEPFVTDFMIYPWRNITTQIAATIWAISLTNVENSLYFHWNRYSYNDLLLWSQFRSAYSNVNILVGSLWYAVGMCGYLQVISYIQVLWTSIDNSQDIIWNGAVEAVITLLGAGVALLAGYLHSTKLNPNLSLFALTFLAACEGGALLLASSTRYRTVSYIGYLIFCVLYSFTITIASAEVAKHLEDDSFGLIFGINTLIALLLPLLQTVLTVVVVVSEEGLSLSVFQQFTVYAVYFFVLSAIYLAAFTYSLLRPSPPNSTYDLAIPPKNENLT